MSQHERDMAQLAVVLEETTLGATADQIAQLGDQVHALITLGTREQWQAWDCLRHAASDLANAAWYLGLDIGTRFKPSITSEETK